MNQPMRPSKQFLIRGAIAIGALVVILSVQSIWFKKLFHKKTATPTITPTTVGDIVAKDSNGNGIPDWEEKLWGLDPTVLYTNGISNKVIIEQKQKSLGISQGEQDDSSLNETDKLARELFTLTAALGQSGEVDSATLQGIAGQLGSSIDVKEVSNHYALKNLRTVKTSPESLTAYKKSLGSTIAKYQSSSADIDVVITALESGDGTRLGELSDTANTYKKFSLELSQLSTPVGLASEHLALINGLYGIGESLPYLQELGTNGVSSLVGIALYKGYSDKVHTAVEAINEYLSQYGIL